MPSVGTPRHVRFGAILGEFRIEFRKKFRGREILRSKPREIAPKPAVPHVLQPSHGPQRSPDTVPSVGMLRRVRFGAILSEFLNEIFEKIFAAAKIRCVSPAAACSG